MIDVAIVMRRLQAIGFSAEQANGLYGQLIGMAAPHQLPPDFNGQHKSVCFRDLMTNQRRNKPCKRNGCRNRVTLLIGLPAALV